MVQIDYLLGSFKQKTAQHLQVCNSNLLLKSLNYFRTDVITFFLNIQNGVSYAVKVCISFLIFTENADCIWSVWSEDQGKVP